MNDPGLHETENEAAEMVEDNKRTEDEEAEQEEQEYLDPRYENLMRTCLCANQNVI
jgi:hypothetical protein